MSHSHSSYRGEPGAFQPQGHVEQPCPKASGRTGALRHIYVSANGWWNCGLCQYAPAPAAYAPRGICPSCGHPPHGKHHSGEMSNNPERVHCGCSAAHAPRAEELEYTVQESFVIQPASLAGLPQHPRKGDLVGFLNSQAPVPFSGCQGDYSTVDNIPIWDILKYLRRSRDASA